MMLQVALLGHGNRKHGGRRTASPRPWATMRSRTRGGLRPICLPGLTRNTMFKRFSPDWELSRSGR